MRAAHLGDRRVALLLHPAGDISDQPGQERWALLEQRGRAHHDVGAGHQVLDGFNGAVHAGRCRERRLDASVEERDPQQRQPYFLGFAQRQRRDDGAGLDVEIRLVEAVEQHERVGAAPRRAARPCARTS